MSEEKGSKLRLRNCGGVPVIDLLGEINGAAVNTLESAIGKLAEAGHYHIIVNLQKAAGANLKALGSLRKTVEQIRKRYGTVDLVAEAGQIREMLRLGNLKGLFRLSSTEAQAIGKIKRLLRLPDDSAAGTSARLTE
jgi:anti-anti-sigma factor